MRVFVVEDSPSLRERLNRALSSIRGIEVIGHAATATDAINRIESATPDAVILDIRLSQGNGLQVLEAVKSEHGERPWIIVLTNYPYPQYRKRFLEAGADYFFDKSVEFERVVDLLKDLERRPPSTNSRAQHGAAYTVA